jgi:hypothetical protein
MTEILPGDFCCVPISGAVGKFISVGEWLDGDGFADYDHAEIYVGYGSELGDQSAPYGYTFGAYPGGARYVPLPCPLDQLPGALWSTGKIPLTEDQRSSILNGCAAAKGIPYSSLDYFALAAHRLHIPAPLLKNYIASSKHMICSQLVDYMYLMADVHLFNDGRWPGYVTPADLANLILNK